MPQFVLSDANWRKFLEDAQRCQQRGVAIPQALVNDMVRARAEYLVCQTEVVDLTAGVQAAKSQLGTVNRDANTGAVETAIIALYSEPLC